MTLQLHHHDGSGEEGGVEFGTSEINNRLPIRASQLKKPSLLRNIPPFRVQILVHNFSNRAVPFIGSTGRCSNAGASKVQIGIRQNDGVRLEVDDGDCRIDGLPSDCVRAFGQSLYTSSSSTYVGRSGHWADA